MKDIFMDLQADHEQFLHGQAHKGMAIGAKNILVRNVFLCSFSLEELCRNSLRSLNLFPILCMIFGAFLRPFLVPPSTTVSSHLKEKGL